MKAEQFKALMANRLPPLKPKQKVLDGEIVPQKELNCCHYWFISNCRARSPLHVDEWCTYCLKEETAEEMAGLNSDVPPDAQIPDDKPEEVGSLEYALYLLKDLRGLLLYLADPKICQNLQPPDRKECSAKVADIDAFLEDQEYEQEDEEVEGVIEHDFNDLDLELDSELTGRDVEMLNRIVDNLPFPSRDI